MLRQIAVWAPTLNSRVQPKGRGREALAHGAPSGVYPEALAHHTGWQRRAVRLQPDAQGPAEFGQPFTHERRVARSRDGPALHRVAIGRKHEALHRAALHVDPPLGRLQRHARRVEVHAAVGSQRRQPIPIRLVRAHQALEWHRWRRKVGAGRMKHAHLPARVALSHECDAAPDQLGWRRIVPEGEESSRDAAGRLSRDAATRRAHHRDGRVRRLAVSMQQTLRAEPLANLFDAG
eukprot:4443114-Prymnesium_polylepis.2